MTVRHDITPPPRLAHAILNLIADRHEHDGLVGDLCEEFQHIVRDRGYVAASRWYWSQTVHSVGPLVLSRLTSDRVTKPVGAVVVGSVTAIVTATLFGLALTRVVDVNAEIPLLTVAAVVTACALVSSMMAGYASALVFGRLPRWTLVFVGLVVVAPDLVYAVLDHRTYGLPWVAIPPLLAILAASTGLALGRRCCRLTRTQLRGMGGSP